MTASLLALLCAALAAPPSSAREAPTPPPPAAADLAPRPGNHAGGETRCAACHTAEDWKKVSFSHNRTGFPLTGRHQAVTCQSCHVGGRFDHQRDARFKLEGKHKPLACEKCHAPVAVKGVAVRRYKPLPLACEGCHADFHRGAFKGFQP